MLTMHHYAEGKSNFFFFSFLQMICAESFSHIFVPDESMVFRNGCLCILFITNSTGATTKKKLVNFWCFVRDEWCAIDDVQLWIL